MPTLRQLALYVLTALLLGCGGGGGGGSSSTPPDSGPGGPGSPPPPSGGDQPDPPPTADEDEPTSPPPKTVDEVVEAPPIDPLSLSYNRMFYPGAQVSLEIPKFWLSQTGPRSRNELERFHTEIRRPSPGYTPSLSVVRTGLTDEPAGTPFRSINVVSRESYEIDGNLAFEEIFDADTQARPDLNLRFMKVAFPLGNDAIAVTFTAEADELSLYTEIVRYIARSLITGATVLQGLDESRDPEIPGRVAIASGTAGALQVACKELSSSQAELIGTIVTADRFEFPVQAALVTLSGRQAGCRFVSPDLAAAGDDFLLVYTAIDGSSRVYAQRLNRFGEKEQAPFLISDHPGSAQQPRVLYDGSRYLVVWTQQMEPDSRTALLGRFVDPLTGPDQIFEIDSDLSADSGDNGGIFTPQVALGNGLIAATWEPYWFRQLAPPPRSVWARLMDLNGQPVTDRIALREPTSQAPRHLQIASGADGFTVAWVEGELTGRLNPLRGSFGIYAKQVTNAGQVLGGEPAVPGIELVAPADTRAIEFLHLRPHPNGYRISWLQSRVVAEAGVYTMLLGPDAEPLSPAQVIRGTFAENDGRGLYAYPAFPASYQLALEEFISFPTERGQLEVWRIPLRNNAK